MAKDMLLEMYQSGLDPRKIIREKGIAQVTDEAIIIEAVKEVITANPKAVADYHKGKENAFQFLFGQTMSKLKGQGSPEAIRGSLKKHLIVDNKNDAKIHLS